MNKFSLLFISTIFLPQLASAESSGPLGFTWGAGSNQLTAIEKIDLSKEYSPFDIEYYCAERAIKEPLAPPENWKLSYFDYSEIGPVDVEYNRAKADLSMDGRLTVYSYTVDVMGVPMTACGAFLDDQLYSVSISHSKNLGRVEGISERVEMALDNKYDALEICGVVGCWVSEESKVYIELSGAYSGLDYYYAPLKAKHMENWAEFYFHFMESFSKSDL